ncbi:MAG: hypothetical protein FWC00_03675 [Firmicutes bacterium]|nr:hypothetical protein [Bacillota bacterium]
MIIDFKGDLIDFFQSANRRHRNAQLCPSCGFGLDDFNATWRMGCSVCYDIFGPYVREALGTQTRHPVFEVPSVRNLDIGNFVVSSRVRLARNLETIPFRTRAEGAFDSVAETIVKRNREKHFASTHVSSLPVDMSHALFEQHLISQELLHNKKNGMIVSEPENRVVIMLGEEDHMRIQSIVSGYDLDGAFASVQKIASDIEKAHPVAKRPDFGYLTSCPTNLGSAMRASVMVFLPALTITGKISAIADKLSSRHLTVRGVYGEGSDFGGYMYQISNQGCHTMTTDEILAMVKAVTLQLVLLEKQTEAGLFKSEQDQIIDGVMRAWGLLTNAHMLTSAEAVENIAFLKLGSNLGILRFKNDNSKIIDDLFFIIQPRTLITQNNRASGTAERDKIRARMVREKLLQARI